MHTATENYPEYMVGLPEMGSLARMELFRDMKEWHIRLSDPDEELITFTAKSFHSGHILHEARKRKGMSLTELSAKTGIGRKRLGQLEREAYPIHSEYAELLCPVLDLPPDTFR